MKYIVNPHPQHTPEWLAARAGRLNGSTVGAIYTKPKAGNDESFMRRDLRIKLWQERMTGIPQPWAFLSGDMRWGIEKEPEARIKFESGTGLLVEEVGYCYWPNLQVGCSPDGLVEHPKWGPGIVEFKCPKSATHIRYLRLKKVPDEYEPQVIHNLWITGAKFCYFQSYDPRCPAPMQSSRVLVVRDQARIDAHERAVYQFLKEVDAEEAAIRREFNIA